MQTANLPVHLGSRGRESVQLATPLFCRARLPPGQLPGSVAYLPRIGEPGKPVVPVIEKAGNQVVFGRVRLDAPVVGAEQIVDGQSDGAGFPECFLQACIQGARRQEFCQTRPGGGLVHPRNSYGNAFRQPDRVDGIELIAVQCIGGVAQQMPRAGHLVLKREMSL